MSLPKLLHNTHIPQQHYQLPSQKRIQIHSFHQFSFLPQYLTNYLDTLFPKGPSEIQIQALLLISGGEHVDDQAPMADGEHNLQSNKPHRYTIPHGNYFNTGTALLMESKSGTGKTLAYLLTALFGTQRREISQDESNAPSEDKQQSATNTLPQDGDVLILVPTNELVWQVKHEIDRLLKPCLERRLFSVQVIEKPIHNPGGGQQTSEAISNATPQTNVAQNSIPPRRIILSTPQRWLNALDSKSIRHLESIAVFVMDEADALMADQTKDQVKRCWSRLFKCRKRQKRQRARVIAFSATFEKWVISDMVHARIILKDDSFFETVIPLFDRSVKGVKEYYTIINKQALRSETLILKEKILVDVLSAVHFHQCIIFCNRKARCNAVMRFLTHNKVHGVAELSGGVKPEVRETVLTKFFSFESPILVATDVAARGLDVSMVDLVINMDVPHEAPTYMHRVGRAGRFERMGAAISIVADTQESLFEYVRRLSSNEISLLPLENLSKLNEYMHTRLTDEEKKKSWETLRESLDKVSEQEIEYLKNADEEVGGERRQKSGGGDARRIPRDYLFDFDLPMMDEGETSFKIGHIQIFLPQDNRRETSAEDLKDMEALHEEEVEHPFSLLRPYELALTNPSQLSKESNFVVFADCAKAIRVQK